ncbi:hypothetical protein [Halomicronema sp. CCY15110]|uniref:hypothetical protein n=1 Tax=Halomicronema sp. CCY15110 TaxID=2767773 RepID=UPI00194DCE66|nr:hypothetical protein [Halomicronema sp. CCY15110]
MPTPRSEDISTTLRLLGGDRQTGDDTPRLARICPAANSGPFAILGIPGYIETVLSKR